MIQLCLWLQSTWMVNYRWRCIEVRSHTCAWWQSVISRVYRRETNHCRIISTSSGQLANRNITGKPGTSFSSRERSDRGSILSPGRKARQGFYSLTRARRFIVFPASPASLRDRKPLFLAEAQSTQRFFREWQHSIFEVLCVLGALARAINALLDTVLHPRHLTVIR